MSGGNAAPARHESQDFKEAWAEVSSGGRSIANHIAGGGDVQTLSADDLQLIRGDYKSRFPTLTEEECRTLPPVAGSYKNAIINIESDGVITAWRLKQGAREWERAGFLAPEGMHITAEQAFGKASLHPPSARPAKSR